VSDQLKKFRALIDALDDRMLGLLNRRAALAQEIGRAKNGPKYRPEREARILRRLVQRDRGPLPQQALTRIYTEIMSACRALEGFARPLVWIAGGRDKGLDFSELAACADGRVRAEAEGARLPRADVYGPHR